MKKVPVYGAFSLFSRPLEGVGDQVLALSFEHEPDALQRSPRGDVFGVEVPRDDTFDSFVLEQPLRQRRYQLGSVPEPAVRLREGVADLDVALIVSPSVGETVADHEPFENDEPVDLDVVLDRDASRRRAGRGLGDGPA
jgi:hypothetical protein